MSLNAGPALTFWNSMSTEDHVTFEASFFPATDPVNDAENWVNANVAAMNALGITVVDDMSMSQQAAFFGSHTVPTTGPAAAGGSQDTNGVLGSLGSILGITLPGFSGGARHFVMRIVEVLLGVILVGAAIKAFAT